MKLLSFAIFLDRDGTIIEDRGIIKDASQVAFLPGVFEALRLLQKYFILFIVTNQDSSLAKSQINKINEYIRTRLASENVFIREIYSCNHPRSTGCNCRKPSPFFLKEAAQKHNIDLSGSYVIGDHPSDIHLASNSGAKGIYILTGHGQKHMSGITAGTIICANLCEAARKISSGHYMEFCTEIQIKQAAQIIKSGDCVAFPTETVYGLGANALDAQAVRKIFELKKRPQNNPLIVHIANVDQLDMCAAQLPEKALLLAREFWPGPITIVLKKKSCIPDNVTSGIDSVAIRIPDHQIALSLINNSGVPIAAPSANKFGYVSPTTALHVKEQFGDNLCILNGGPCRVGIESTIISFLEQQPVLLRPGGISLEKIESVIGTLRLTPSKEISPLSPGRLPSHYAPKTPLVITDDPSALGLKYRVGFLSFSSNFNTDLYTAVEILSKSGDLYEAASNLYAAIQRMDKLNLDMIITTLVANEGIGKTINDRLLRASRNTINESLHK